MMSNIAVDVCRDSYLTDDPSQLSSEGKMIVMLLKYIEELEAKDEN